MMRTSPFLAALSLIISTSGVVASPLKDAVDKMDAAAIESAIAKGASVNEQISGGMTPIFFAISNDRIDIVRLLIRIGADVNYVTDDNSLRIMPIHYAAYLGRTTIIDLLIDNRASVNATNLYQAAPLAMAAMKDKAESIYTLLKRGSDLNARDIGGKTALHVAASGAYTNAITVLMLSGADPTIKDNDGKIAADLITASSEGSVDSKTGSMAALQLTPKVVASSQSSSNPIPCNDLEAVVQRMRRNNPRASAETIMRAVRQYQELRGCIAPPNR